MRIRGQRLAGCQAAQCPPGLYGFIRSLEALQHPLPHLLPVLPGHGFHGSKQAQHVVIAAMTALASVAHRGLLHGLLHGGSHGFQHLHLLCFVQACRHTAPEHPPFRPAGSVPGVSQPLRIQSPDLLHAPAVQLRPHAGAQAPACKVEPHALMVGRAAAALGTGQQSIKQCAQQRHIPAVPRAQHLFERLAQLAHVLGRDVLGLGAKDALYQRHRFRQFAACRLQAFLAASACCICADSYVFCFGIAHRTTHAEGQQPGLRRIGHALHHTHAAHLQRADFGHAGLQLHLDLRQCLAFRSGQHGGQRRQLHPAFALQRQQLPGLCGQLAAIGQQHKAHGLPQPERKAPARQHHAHAFFRAFGQQADQLRRCLLFAGQQQPVAAGRTSANRWNYRRYSCQRLSCLC